VEAPGHSQQKSGLPLQIADGHPGVCALCDDLRGLWWRSGYLRSFTASVLIAHASTLSSAISGQLVARPVK